MKLLLPLLLSLGACAAAAPKPRAPASSDTIPKCWKARDPKLHDGLYHITIPASDSLTARDVQTMIFSLQAFGVAHHDVSAVGGEGIVLEAQFVSLDEAKNLGYPTQEKLDGLVEFVLKDIVPYVDKGVKISCFEEHPLRRH